MKTIDHWTRGDGPEIETGYRRGDSWVQIAGPHAECEKRVTVVGPGIGRDRKTGAVGPGILVRCGGCMGSWVIR